MLDRDNGSARVIRESGRRWLWKKVGREKPVGKYPRVIRMSGCSHSRLSATTRGIASGGRETGIPVLCSSWRVPTRLDKRIDRIDRLTRGLMDLLASISMAISWPSLGLPWCNRLIAGFYLWTLRCRENPTRSVYEFRRLTDIWREICFFHVSHRKRK